MFQILSHTPLFVFILFFVLLIFGFLQTRNRKIKPLVAFILPFFMIILSVISVISTFGINLVSVGLWLSGLLVISFVLYKLFPLKGAIYFEAENKLFIPGSWIPFVVIMAIFFTKYTIAIIVAMQSPLVHELSFIIFLSFMYGCFSGYFTSRALTLHTVKREHQKNI